MEKDPPALMSLFGKKNKKVIETSSQSHCLKIDYFSVKFLFINCNVICDDYNDPIVEYKDKCYVINLDSLTNEELVFIDKGIEYCSKDFDKHNMTFGENKFDPVIRKVKELLYYKYGSRYPATSVNKSGFKSYVSEDDELYDMDKGAPRMHHDVYRDLSVPLQRSRSPYVKIPQNLEETSLKLLDGWKRINLFNGSVRYRGNIDGKMYSFTSKQYFLFLNKGEVPKDYVPKDFSPGRSLLTSNTARKTVEFVKRNDIKKKKIIDKEKDIPTVIREKFFPDWFIFKKEFSYSVFKNKVNAILSVNPELIKDFKNLIKNVDESLVTDYVLFNHVLKSIVNSIGFAKITRCLIVMKKMIDEESFLDTVNECGDIFFTTVKKDYVNLFFSDDAFRSFVSDQLILLSVKPTDAESSFSAINTVFNDIRVVVKEKRLKLQKALDKVNDIRNGLIRMQKKFDEIAKPVVDSIKHVNQKMSGQLDENDIDSAKIKYASFKNPVFTFDIYLTMLKHKKSVDVRERIAKESLNTFQSVEERFRSDVKSFEVDDKIVENALTVFEGLGKEFIQQPLDFIASDDEGEEEDIDKKKFDASEEEESLNRQFI